jgi:hypothetical protein
VAVGHRSDADASAGSIRIQSASLLWDSYMKSWSVLLALALVSTAALAALPAGHPKVDHRTVTPAANGVSDSEMTQQGKVLGVLDTKGFTYIEVKQDARTLWVAVPTTAVKVGDTVRFENGPVMASYESKSLKRTFSNVMFVSRVIVNARK